MTRSLFKTVLALMLVSSALPVGLFAWLAVTRNAEALVTNARELAEERVSRLRVQIAAQLGESARAVESTVKSPEFATAKLEDQRRFIGALLSQHEELLALTLFDRLGNRVPGLQAFPAGSVSQDELSLHELTARALMQGARHGAFSEPRYSKSLQAMTVTVVLPLLAPHGEVTGYAGAELSLGPVAELIAAQRLGASGHAYLVDARGHLIAHKDQARVQGHEDLSQTPVVKNLLETLPALSGGSARVGDFDLPDGRRLAAFAVVPDVNWGVIVEEPVSDAYVLVRRMKEQAWVGLGLALLLALGLGTAFSRGVTRPLKSFVDAAMQIATGKFGVQVKVETKNELGELAKTFNYMSQQLLAYDSENRGLYASLEEGYVETIVALANSIDSKDAYTRGHSQRVGEMAAEIGREMALTEREVRHLLYGGILHDIGKIGVIEPILCKRTKLTDDEMEVMRGHPAMGGTIIEAVSFLKPVLPAVRNHHERWDGTGYPDKLKGEEIPVLARIVNCADTWDACTSTRPYQKAMEPEKALGIIRKLAGTQLDPKVCDALERVVRKKQARGERVSAYEGEADDLKAQATANDAQAEVKKAADA